MTDDVDIERALETQRRKLLRLLTGLFAAFEILSVVSVDRELPRWFVSMSYYILCRAESAAQCLVLVQTRLLTRQGVDVVAVSQGRDYAKHKPPYGRRLNSQGERLRNQIRALQDVLTNLRDHAVRKMRLDAERHLAALMQGTRSNRIVGFQRSADQALRLVPAGHELVLSRVERPPDKVERGYFRCV